jgi:NAD(P)-dependent dehydrogenase (short-subunit alcohol dehydrogenase family)
LRSGSSYDQGQCHENACHRRRWSRLGLSIAKIFGRNGFQVALIARNQAKLDDLAAQLAVLGIEAAGFPADLMDRPSLVDAFAGIKERYGVVDVLEYSPAPHTPVPGLEIAGPLAITVENLQPQIDFYLHGAITAVQQVLPVMLERGSGTLLFTTGGSAVYPNPMMGNVGIAGAGLRNWAYTLHAALADKGIYAGHISINTWIGTQPGGDADSIAQLYWDMEQKRDRVEVVFGS